MLAEYEEQARAADESGGESAEEEFQSYAAAAQLRIDRLECGVTAS
jgi:hypothetical protein